MVGQMTGEMAAQMPGPMPGAMLAPLPPRRRFADAFVVFAVTVLSLALGAWFLLQLGLALWSGTIAALVTRHPSRAERSRSILHRGPSQLADLVGGKPPGPTVA